VVSEQGTDSDQESPGRYNRSFGGLTASVVVIVVLVVGIFLLRDLVFGTPPEPQPESVEYLDSVQQLQQNGFDVVYPVSLPEDWIVTEVGAELGEQPSYRFNLYTSDEEFVGIRQESLESARLEELLEQYVDEKTGREDPLIDVGDIASTWEGWSDDGGDVAYSAEVAGTTVLVFGDVPADELADLVSRLGTDEVATPEPVTPPS